MLPPAQGRWRALAVDQSNRVRPKSCARNGSAACLGPALRPIDLRGTPVEPLLKGDGAHPALRPVFTTIVDRASFDAIYEAQE